MDRAGHAIWTFRRDGGSFQRDSKKSDHSSITTTARCYMALAYMESQLSTSDDLPFDWRSQFNLYQTNYPFTFTEGQFLISEPREDEEANQSLNNFEVAHLADFVFVSAFLERFPCAEKDRTTSSPSDAIQQLDELQDRIRTVLECRLNTYWATSTASGTEFPFDEGTNSSTHYFVTLHALRALDVLSWDREPFRPFLSQITDDARRFCIEQCFYCQRHITHRQDPARLVFASTIYCMYADEVDRDVMVAIAESIGAMQEPSGKWPASHPIARERPKGAWYIASSELALCLTWLYFQPKLPDAARHLVLEMLQRHFQNWIIPTFKNVFPEAGDTQKPFSGWFDDSAMGQDKVVGWTTGIVGHFLANYLAVLDDRINRTVIEHLGLENVATRYLIDEISKERNPRWSRDATGDCKTQRWPDLPPMAWKQKTDHATVARSISEAWTDPEKNSRICRLLATRVLSAVLDTPKSLPDSDMLAGILDGPPGTRKTSLVKAVAEYLSWPYVPVPASTIFDSGFDNMEARATTVFRYLTYLTRCVIFFDEFEEFFRDRNEQTDSNRDTAPSSASAASDPQSGTQKITQPLASNGEQSNQGTRFSPHDRTIAAFTTSAMLARMQDLHDAGQSLIFLATNHFHKLDDAIVRAGRFDFMQTIDHPTIDRFSIGDGSFLRAPGDRMLRSLQTTLGSEELDTAERIIAQVLVKQPLQSLLNDLTEKLVQDGSHSGEVRVTFSMIEKAVRAIVGHMREMSAPIDDKALESIAIQQMKFDIKRVVERTKGPGPLSDPS